VDSAHRYVKRGTTGRIRVPGKLWVPFEVTACEDRTWRWRVARVPAIGHRVYGRGASCVAAFEIPLYAAGYAPVCRRGFDRLEAIVTQW